MGQDIEATHPYFADLPGLEAVLAKRFKEWSAANPSKPIGSFESLSGQRLQGFVDCPEWVVGVWAEMGDNDKTTDVVFWSVWRGQLLLKQDRDLRLSKSGIVQAADYWLTNELASRS